MNAKAISLTLLGTVMLASVPALAMAAGPHSGPAACPGIMERCERPAARAHHITPEQMAQYKEFRNERKAALAPLRHQLTQKRMELRALSPNPNVKPEELKALVAEIMELRGKIAAVNKDFRDKMKKAGLPSWLGSKKGAPFHKFHRGSERAHGQYHGCYR